MKKIKKLLICMLMIVPCILLLSACGDDKSKSNLKNFEGLALTSISVDYDGTEKEIVITGTLPEGATVAYTSNKATNAGTYNATAVVKCDGYNDLTLNATLTINKLNYDLTNTKWDYESAFTYDGTEKKVELLNLPEGVTVANYTSNTAINAGTYTASVTLNYDTTNHRAPNIPNQTWEIKKATITGITFENKTVEYDSQLHSIELVGNIPAGSTTKITYNGYETCSVSAVGNYTVKLVIENPNYETYETTATLTIKSTEEQLYAINQNGKIYFQNNLDSNKLYVYSGGTVTKVNNDIPKYFVANGNNLYYYSSSLFSKVIKSLNGTIATRLADVSGEFLTCDGEYIYYAISNLLLNTDKNGIYKLKLDGTQTEEIRLVKDKAEYLTYYDGKIYYSNKSDGGKLYCISTSSKDVETGTQLWEEKVSFIIEDDGVLYFNSTKTTVGIGVASSIRKYVISESKTIKLTIDNGQYLTKIGNDIYYINKDKITSTIFGDGIYSVSSLKTEDSSLVGAKIVSCEDGNGYSSLTSDETNLYFYKLNDKHLYSYNILTKNETDLMENFELPIEEVTPTGFAKLTEYNGEIYYINPLDDGCLYKYNIATKSKYKVLSNSVSNVYFYQGYMYYSTYISVNYALWRMNLLTNETTKISTSRCDNLIFDGEYIYYVKVGSVWNNYIMKMKLDGSEVEEILSNKNLWVASFEKVDNYLYFAINPKVGYKYIYRYDLTTKKAESLNLRAKYFIIENGKIYFNDIDDNNLTVYDISTKHTDVIVSNVETNNMIIVDNELYYSSSSKTNTGLYKYNLSTKNSTKLSEKCADGMIEYNGDIYFIQTSISYTNDYPYQSNGDANIYVLKDSTITKI